MSTIIKVICKNEEVLTDLRNEFLISDTTEQIDIARLGLTEYPKGCSLVENCGLLTYPAYADSDWLYYVVFDSKDRDPLDFDLITTSSSDRVIELIREQIIKNLKESKMENKFYGTIPEYEKLVAELQKELDGQNEIIEKTLGFVEQMAANNAKWGQNLLDVTREFHSFRTSVTISVVCFVIGLFITTLINR